MTIIANPLYDAVFYFLMEDERAAKIFLSALLKKEVCELKMYRNEHTKLKRGCISLFRLDFFAKLVDASGKEEQVRIELRKTWRATKTLHLRQYLAAQYTSKDNMSEPDNSKGPDLPVISIYILAHKVGDLQQPVVYVCRRCLNEDNQQSEAAISDPFIDSLTNDSIIIQVPYLQQHARNHLERLLSVFDQHYCLAADDHLLAIDDAGMSDDERLLLFRLVMAAASPAIRRDMQVEDEILTEIEVRDTTIMLMNKQIEEIEERKRKLAQQEQMIEQKEQENEQLLRASVKNFSALGKSAAEIADMLGKPQELIVRLMEEIR